MLQTVRLPFVRFETEVAESKDAEGHAVYKNKYTVYITPAGGKDEVVKNAEEWLVELRRKGETRGPFDQAANEYGVWYDRFSKVFEQYKAGEEMTFEGIPLRACMAFLKAEIVQCERAHIYSLEDLANVNEEGLGHIGLNARTLKHKAQEILKNKGDSKQAEEVVALRLQVEELKTQVQQLLDSGLELHKKRGRVAMQQAA